jgi:sugar lactone lactonase YvrE
MNLRRCRIQGAWSATVIAAAIIGLPGQAVAETLFASAFSAQEIVSVDTNTNAVTPIATTPGNPDSLIFDPAGNIIYTDEKFEALREVNLTTHSDTVLSSNFGVPADLALEPGGHSVLVSDFTRGVIIRYNLVSQSASVFAQPGGNPEGLAFDATGRLFANLGVRSAGPTGKFVAQLDPTTGAILHSSPGLNSLDGLTFDSVTGKLYATSRLSGAVYAIDPNNLANVSILIQPGTLVTPDGLTSDGKGNLFIAVQGDSRVYQYNFASQVLTPETVVPGTLDDLAPASGLGSRPVPEPGSLLLASLGALTLAGAAWRRRRRDS